MAYTLHVSRKLITVAETPLFVRQAGEVWDETERDAFVNFIAWNPEAGDVVPDTGGVRKIRWGRSGKGRRGGARVIYFYRDVHSPLYLLMVYTKAQREDLTPDEKRMVRKLAILLKGKRE
jgi:mRNA-degrading endonuclease RelE of RelBE toxin-antitoxin system